VEHRTADLRAVRPVEGRQAIEAMCRSWLEQTPSFEYEVERVLSDDATAAACWRYAVQGPGDGPETSARPAAAQESARRRPRRHRGPDEIRPLQPSSGAPCVLAGQIPARVPNPPGSLDSPLELEGVSWLTCERGVIREARVYFDSLGLYRGLGRV
jgi:hypothetical protein